MAALEDRRGEHYFNIEYSRNPITSNPTALNRWSVHNVVTPNEKLRYDQIKLDLKNNYNIDEKDDIEYNDNIDKRMNIKEIYDEVWKKYNKKGYINNAPRSMLRVYTLEQLPRQIGILSYNTKDKKKIKVPAGMIDMYDLLNTNYEIDNPNRMDLSTRTDLGEWSSLNPKPTPEQTQNASLFCAIREFTEETGLTIPQELVDRIQFVRKDGITYIYRLELNTLEYNILTNQYIDGTAKKAQPEISNIYFNKYLKYKEKYLKLKNKLK